jgi:hypothetical protein
MAALKQRQGAQRQGANSSIAAIVTHPLRSRCWTVLAERVASPNELKDILAASLGDVSYHVGVLKKLGVVELVRTEPRRGAVEHFYRAIERPTIEETEYAVMSRQEREDFDLLTAQLAFADVSSSFEQGTFCRRTNHALIRVPTEVDEEGFEELHQASKEFLEKVYDIQAASAERMSNETDAESIPVTALAMSFEKPARPEATGT